MTAFLAIVKLTCRSAFRSHIFRLLLALLLLSIVLLPITLKSDGTPKGEVQLLLQYCLGFVGFILCVSSVWLACSEISSDVETSQLHMIVVKPVHRIVVLLGKYTGVVLIHFVLLFLAAAAVYGFLVIRLPNLDSTDQKEAEARQMLNDQVLTARALYLPERPDFTAFAQRELERRVAAAKERGQDVEQYKDDQSRSETLYEIRRELIATRGLLQPEETVFWTFKGLPDDLTDNDTIFVRYTVYLNRNYIVDQGMSKGSWAFVANYTRQTDDGTPETLSDVVGTQTEEIITGLQTEFLVPIRNSFFVHNGTAQLGFLNADDSELNFEEGKGPFLLIPVTGFFSNYCRTIAVLALGILTITLLAAAVSAYLSLPIAIFFTAAYMMLGGLADYLVSSFPDIEGYRGSFGELFGRGFGTILLQLIVPLQDFFVTGLLANGELVSLPFIGGLVVKDLLIRMLPLFLIGALLYTRRELALAAKR